MAALQAIASQRATCAFPKAAPSIPISSAWNFSSLPLSPFTASLTLLKLPFVVLPANLHPFTSAHSTGVLLILQATCNPLLGKIWLYF